MLDQLRTVLNGVQSRSAPAGTLVDLLRILANTAVAIALITSLAALAFAFFQFVTSMGDPKAIDRAKTSLTWAIISFLVAALAFALARIFLGLFGVSATI